MTLVTGRPADASIECNLPAKTVDTRLVPESAFHRQWGLKRRFADALTQCVREQADDGLIIIHDHGLWLANNHATAIIARKFQIKRVVSPRGMLSEWAIANRRWKKRLAWRMFQHSDLLSADAFHATSEMEADDLRKLGFQQPIAVIPNGVDVPTETTRLVNHDGLKRALFLSRIHPKKGLFNLVRAWANVRPVGWRLILAGPNEAGHQLEVERLANELGIATEIIFTGALDDDEKWNEFRRADLFVLPSFSENFGIVVAEALAVGVPVISTTGTPWQVLVENKIGWWIDPNSSALAAALTEAIGMSDQQRLEMGMRAADWVRSRFSWPSIAERMLAFYGYLLGNGNRPDFVVD